MIARGRTIPGPLAALLLACAVLLWHGYSSVLRDPDGVLFADRDDGLKNYYTFLYHVQHDHDAWEMKGMEHPYGEHVLYTDGHPLLSMLVRGLRPVFPALPSHGVAILNLLMVLGIPACALVLFLLLRDLGAAPWAASAGAFGIAMLAPQADRMYGHFALSYAVFLPLTWWLLVRAVRAERWWPWAVALCGFSVWWWGTHAYLGAMASLFGGLWLVLLGSRAWKEFGHRRIGTLFLAVCLLPLVLFQGVLSFTDGHKGRSEHPSGFFNYTAEPDDLLFPFHPPLNAFWDRVTDHGIGLQWEANAYIGLVSILVLLAWPLVAWSKRRKGVALSGPAPEVRAAIGSAAVLLLFAFCIPFKDFPDLVHVFPFIEQFRAVGRFDLPFHPVITVTAVLLLDRWTRAWPAAARAGLLFVAVGWTAWEASGLHAHDAAIARRRNLFALAEWPEDRRRMLDRLDPSTYQAILPLPFFHYGSESFTRPQAEGMLQLVLPLSFRTGLPMLGGILSRTSVPESKNGTEVIAPRYGVKPLESDLHDDRPFLVVTGDAPLGTYEAEILRDAVPLDRAAGLQLHVITKQRLFRSVNADRWAAFERERPLLHERKGFLVRDTLAFVHHDPMDTLPSPVVLRGPGGLATTKRAEAELARIRLAGVRKGTPMVASVWMYNAVPEGLDLRLEMRVGAPGGEAFARTFPDESPMIQGDWTLVELGFVPPEDEMDIVIRLHCSDRHDRPLYADELLVRPAGVDVYRVDRTADGKEELFLNDHRIPAP